MANKNPVQTPEFKANIRKPYDGLDQRIGSKVFGLKLPIEYQEKLLSYTKEDRVSLMRSAVMEAIDKHEQN